MLPHDAIRESTIRELISSSSLWTASIKGEHCGFSIVFQLGNNARVLLSSRGETRRFANLNTAADFLKQLGLCKFEVDTSSYVAGRIRKARPDRAEALRKTRTIPIQQELLNENLD